MKSKLDRRWLVAILAAAAVVFAYPLFPRVGKVERVATAPPNFRSALGIDRGRWVFADASSGVTIRYVPLRGGPETTLIADFQPKGQFANCLKIGPDFLVVSYEESATPGDAPGPKHLYRIPSDGSKPEELPPHRISALTEETLYWIRPKGSVPGSKLAPPVENGDWMATSLQSGTSRRIGEWTSNWGFGAIGPGSAVVVRQQGGGSELHLAFPPEFRRTVIKGFHRRNLDGIAYANGRIYWAERTTPLLPTESDTAPGPWALISAAVDGSDRDVLYSAADGGCLVMGAHRGKVYANLFDERRQVLHVVEPERSPAIRKLAPLEGHETGHFDGDYYYFTRTETLENWLNWSNDGLQLERQAGVYRVQLPKMTGDSPRE